VGDKHQLRFALAAFGAGLLWGYLRNRRSGHATVFSLLQGLEWFVAYGGAAAMIELVRHTLDDEDDADAADETTERITRLRQVVTEPTGTDG